MTASYPPCLSFSLTIQYDPSSSSSPSLLFSFLCPLALSLSRSLFQQNQAKCQLRRIAYRVYWYTVQIYMANSGVYAYKDLHCFTWGSSIITSRNACGAGEGDQVYIKFAPKKCKKKNG